MCLKNCLENNLIEHLKEYLKRHQFAAGLGNKPPQKKNILKLNFGRDNLFGCDNFISRPTVRWGMIMTREALPNALNAQLFNSKVGVYFRGGLFPWGFISVGVYFLSKMKWGFFPWGFFPQPICRTFIENKFLIYLKSSEKLRTTKPLLFSLHILFRHDQNHHSNFS